MISLPDFTQMLDDLGIDSYEAGQSIVIKDCPACGAGDYKVLLRVTEERNKFFFGRCQHGSCQQNYSSLSYLIKSGADRLEALAIHGLSVEKTLERMAENALPKIEIEKPIETEKPIEYIEDTFMNIETWEEHPASMYARKRGYNEKFKDIIKINHKTSSVVFLVKDDKGIIGYQERFTNPVSSKLKAKTSPGFSKSKSLLIFGDEPDRDFLVCEGPFTALSAWHYGYIGICTFGSSVSSVQTEEICRIVGDRGVGIAIETQESGVDQANKKMVDSLSRVFYWKDKSVYTVRSVSSGDLNDAWMNGSDIEKSQPIDIDPAIPNISHLFN